MFLIDQLVSHEFSKKIKEHGVKQDSLFYWDTVAGGAWEIKTSDSELSDQSFSAFTLAELFNLMHSQVVLEKLKDEYLSTEHVLETHHEYKKDKNPANSMAEMFIYLIENKLN